MAKREKDKQGMKAVGYIRVSTEEQVRKRIRGGRGDEKQTYLR